MAHTYTNADGVLVVDAGSVELESASDVGPAAAADNTEEVSADVVRDCAGE